METAGLVDKIIALAAVDGLLTDSKSMTGLGEMFVEKSKPAERRTFEARVLGEVRIAGGAFRRSVTFDFGDYVGTEVLASGIQQMRRKSHHERSARICRSKMKGVVCCSG